jgi:glycerol-3-phosphate dehydrogenase
MQTLQGDAEGHGAAFAFATTVDSIESSSRVQTVKLTASSVATGETHEMECDYFINATGIFAPRLVKTSQQKRPEITDRFAKGTYFKLRDNSRPFRCDS